MASQSQLVLVSNRGPVTFQAGGEVKRGTGGLVTALIGLASYREATWIASAMTDEDVEQSESHNGEAFPVRAPDGGESRFRRPAELGPTPTPLRTTRSPAQPLGPQALVRTGRHRRP